MTKTDIPFFPPIYHKNFAAMKELLQTKIIHLSVIIKNNHSKRNNNIIPHVKLPCCWLMLGLTLVGEKYLHIIESPGWKGPLKVI